MKILLIGASGMIGSRVAAEAALRGHTVIGVSRHPERIVSDPNVQAFINKPALRASSLTPKGMDNPRAQS